MDAKCAVVKQQESALWTRCFQIYVDLGPGMDNDDFVKRQNSTRHLIPNLNFALLTSVVL